MCSRHGVSLLLCGVGVGGVARWFDRNKESLKADGEAAMAQGRAFAKTDDADGCVTEALRRRSEQSGLMAEATNKIFLKACLQEAPAPDGFCEDVPAPDEIVSSAMWAVEECERRGHEGDQACARLVGAVREYCGGR